ncbi:uncharacterized protein LOC105845979 [Hydra vulgaris]|uniref:uncharacterized protein LOC105845979 n=1 Tax=Hydra vulgaris TaxID=6087 RepID=UPI0006414804|nr:uncharacterized protein LOC105845979 [Hydra vulgaris]
MRELLNIQKETILSYFRESLFSINEKFENFQSSFQEVRRELDEMKSGLNFVGDVFNDKARAVEEKINKVHDDLSNVRKMQGKISSDNIELKLKSVDIEDRNRRNNLRIDGIVENSEEKDWEITKKRVKQLFKDNLGIEKDIIIKRAHRVGATNDKRERTIVLKLRDYEDKKTIMERAVKLKGTNSFLNEDFSFTTQKVRKELFDQAKIRRQNGYFAKVVYNKLIVHEFQENTRNTDVNPTCVNE